MKWQKRTVKNDPLQKDEGLLELMYKLLSLESMVLYQERCYSGKLLPEESAAFLL